MTYRSTAPDPEDLWDFGTVKTTGRPGTIGRASGVQPSGPPLTWDYNNNTPRSRGSSGSGASIASTNGPRRGPSSESDSGVSSITVKADRLPSLPSSDRGPSRRIDQQATVRHGVVGSTEGNGVHREPSDDYDDLEDHLPEDDLPDTTMLDSVVLPAIASVGQTSFKPVRCKLLTYFFFLALPPCGHARGASCFERPAESIHGG
jgi:serine/threonine-protein kinase 24/25/MST4